MTTLRDYLDDLIKEAKLIKEKAKDQQRLMLDDDMKYLEEIEEGIETELLDEYMEYITKRLIG